MSNKLLELGEQDDGESVDWLVASNVSRFDAEAAFRKLPEVDWSETSNAKIRVGDTIFLYGSDPVRALTHECIVTKTGITRDDELIDDYEFWRSTSAFDDRVSRTWMRLRLVQSLSPRMRKELSFSKLMKSGLNGPPQGRMKVPAAVAELILTVKNRAFVLSGDSNAENAEFDERELKSFLSQIEAQDFSVTDNYATSKTRGSAQRAFAREVKANYGFRCAVTGISTKEFLVASHIVPWSEDKSIRLDPSNGICLSTLVDRAFDVGYLSVTTDFRIKINRRKLSSDSVLSEILNKYDGLQLQLPPKSPPNPAFLARRNALFMDQGAATD